MRSLRRLAAILLVVSMLLPLSECSWTSKKAPTPTSISQRLFPQNNHGFDYHYAYKHVDFTLLGALTLVAFVWPLVSVVLLEGRIRFLLFQPIEILLCGGTFYWLNLLTFGGRYLYGAYVGTAAIIVFGLATTIDWLQALMHRKRMSNRSMRQTATHPFKVERGR